MPELNEGISRSLVVEQMMFRTSFVGFELVDGLPSCRKSDRSLMFFTRRHVNLTWSTRAVFLSPISP